jgi:hypothetical protein
MTQSPTTLVARLCVHPLPRPSPDVGLRDNVSEGVDHRYVKFDFVAIQSLDQKASKFDRDWFTVRDPVRTQWQSRPRPVPPLIARGFRHARRRSLRRFSHRDRFERPH